MYHLTSAFQRFFKHSYSRLVISVTITEHVDEICIPTKFLVTFFGTCNVKQFNDYSLVLSHLTTWLMIVVRASVKNLLSAEKKFRFDLIWTKLAQSIELVSWVDRNSFIEATWSDHALQRYGQDGGRVGVGAKQVCTIEVTFFVWFEPNVV